MLTHFLIKVTLFWRIKRPYEKFNHVIIVFLIICCIIELSVSIQFQNYLFSNILFPPLLISNHCLYQKFLISTVSSFHPFTQSLNFCKTMDKFAIHQEFLARVVTSKQQGFQFLIAYIRYVFIACNYGEERLKFPPARATPGENFNIMRAYSVTSV